MILNKAISNICRKRYPHPLTTWDVIEYDPFRTLEDGTMVVQVKGACENGSYLIANITHKELSDEIERLKPKHYSYIGKAERILMMMHNAVNKLETMGFNKNDPIIAGALRKIRDEVNAIEARIFKRHPTRRCGYCNRPVYKGKTVITASGNFTSYHKDCYNKKQEF
jgi:hypothetical protein